MIDKMLRTFNNDSSFYKNRLEFLKKELQRMEINPPLLCKDINSFSITAITALLGLNKENIENLDKHGNYEKFSFSKKMLESINFDNYYKNFPDFITERKITSNFDEWLSIENCDYPSLNYMMNIRNGILHSEYEPLDEYGYIFSINNSNYTHFKSKVILPGIKNFCIFFFGNNSWTGLSEQMLIYEINVDVNQITTKEELHRFLADSFMYNKIDYETTKKVTDESAPEKKVYKTVDYKYRNYMGDINKLLKEAFKSTNYSIKPEKLTNDQIQIIIEMVEHYYGNEFYTLNIESQRRQISIMHKYLMNSRSIISEWICDHLYLVNIIRELYFVENQTTQAKIEKFIEDFKCEINNRSVFACHTALLFIKLYHVLYRLQNKKYEEVDYKKIDFDTESSDYNYERTDIDGSITNNFNLDKIKLQAKNPSLSDKEIEIKVICEIIRNALSHGNMEMNFKIENNELKEYVVLSDDYHHKLRKIEMTLEKLETFVNSEAFTTKECLIKEEKELSAEKTK